MGRRERRANGTRLRRPPAFHLSYGDGERSYDRSTWSATEHAIDKWIARLGTPEMSRTEALWKLLEAAQSATRERDRARNGCLYYRVAEPQCRLIVKHHPASGYRIVTVMLRDAVGEEVFEVDDAA